MKVIAVIRLIMDVFLCTGACMGCDAIGSNMMNFEVV